MTSDLQAREAKIFGMPNTRDWRLMTRSYKVRDRLLPHGSRRGKWIKRCWNALLVLIKFGPVALMARILQELRALRVDRWIRKHQPTRTEINSQKKHIFKRPSTICLLLPITGISSRFAGSTVVSLLQQTYANWELKVAVLDECDQMQLASMKKYAAEDERINIAPVLDSGNAADKQNAALANASGEYIALLEAGDIVAPNALFEIQRELQDDSQPSILYTDEDRISEDGRRRWDPWFKPDWSPDLLRSYNYISHLLVIKKTLWDKIGGFRAGYEGSQEYDLILRASENADKVIHIPKVLYHRRSSPGSKGIHLVHPVFSRDGETIRRAILGTCQPTQDIVQARSPKYKFSLIILNRNAPEFILPLLESLRTPELDRSYEVIVGDTGTTDQKVLHYYQKVPAGMKVFTNLNYHFSRNYNQLAGQHTQSEWLGIMNNDIVLENTRFLEDIEKAFRADPRLGVVGAKLLYPNGRLQHGGVFFFEQGLHRGLPFHRMHGQDPAALPRYEREAVPAVTGSFLFCRAVDFRRLGGFDEGYEEEAQDVDLCLKFRREGWSIACMDLGRILHIENGTRPKGSENWKDREYFIRKWIAFLEATLFTSELNRARRN